MTLDPFCVHPPPLAELNFSARSSLESRLTLGPAGKAWEMPGKSGGTGGKPGKEPFSFLLLLSVCLAAVFK